MNVDRDERRWGTLPTKVLVVDLADGLADRTLDERDERDHPEAEDDLDLAGKVQNLRGDRWTLGLAGGSQPRQMLCLHPVRERRDARSAATTSPGDPSSGGTNVGQSIHP